MIRLVTFRSGAHWQAGFEVDGMVVPIQTIHSAQLSVKDVLRLDPAHVDALLEAAQAARSGSGALALESVHLGPPIPDPEKIICLGLNYKDHAAEANLPIPKAPVLFPKYRNSLVGPHDDVVVPAVAVKELDYEVELAVVIGRRARRVTRADALSYVGGYTVMNDLSARDLQMQTSQWGAGKAIDGFAPMGPGIVPARFIADPQSIMLSTRVNGERLQHESTAQMIFGIAETIAFITQFMTLEPGDIIATGTPAGVGFTRTPPVRLQRGDLVEVEAEGIGTLRNRIVHEDA